MKPIDQFATLKEFTTEIEQSGSNLPFKIMGKRRQPDHKVNFNGIYYTASMLVEAYKNIEDPDRSPGYNSIPTHFGEILKVGCRLYGGSQTYSSAITPNPKTGVNLLQGDIIAFNLSQNVSGFSSKLVMIISHSCAIANADCIVVVPVYLESELDEAILTQLRGKAPKNIFQIRGNMLSNELVNYLGLPAAVIPAVNNEEERLLVCLNLQTMVRTKIIPTLPFLRLTYRALTYFQLRLALLYLRDVQDSDDTREF